MLTSRPPRFWNSFVDSDIGINADSGFNPILEGSKSSTTVHGSETLDIISNPFTGRKG